MAGQHIYEESWSLGPQSTQFYTRTYRAQPSKAAVVFVHGFIEHVARYDHIFPLWAARGISVFAYDQRGFGRTALDSEKRSRHIVYARTSWKEQLEDIDWAIRRTKEQFRGQPLFLYGHSMGGALVIAFATREQPPPSKETVSLLSGVIATSPFFQQTNPPSWLAHFVAQKASIFLPNLTIPAAVNFQDISRDRVVQEAYRDDPLIKQIGSLQILSDMITNGPQLVRKDYERWPPRLPILLIHGTDDKVTSCPMTEAFHTNVLAHDKKLSLYHGGFHELHNEPEGVKERLADECISWVEARLRNTDIMISKL